MIRDIPSAAFPQQPRGARSRGADVRGFSWLGFEGKGGKKKIKKGAEERPTPRGEVIAGFGLAASQICRGCAPEGFFCGVKGSAGPHAPVPDAQGSQAPQILRDSSPPHPSGISFGQRSQENKAILHLMGHFQASCLAQEHPWKQKNPQAASSPKTQIGGQADPSGSPSPTTATATCLSHPESLAQLNICSSSLVVSRSILCKLLLAAGV